MEIVKQTEEYQIIKKRSGRYGVRGANRKWISGEEKVKILIAEGLVKAPEPKPEPEATLETVFEPEPEPEPEPETDPEPEIENADVSFGKYLAKSDTG